MIGAHNSWRNSKRSLQQRLRVGKAIFTNVNLSKLIGGNQDLRIIGSISVLLYLKSPLEEGLGFREPLLSCVKCS